MRRWLLCLHHYILLVVHVMLERGINVNSMLLFSVFVTGTHLILLTLVKGKELGHVALRRLLHSTQTSVHVEVVHVAQVP